MQEYGTTHPTRQIARKKRGNLRVSGSGSFSVKIDLDVCQHVIFNEAGKKHADFPVPWSIRGLRARGRYLSHFNWLASCPSHRLNMRAISQVG